jgi:hypothetical protein
VNTFQKIQRKARSPKKAIESTVDRFVENYEEFEQWHNSFESGTRYNYCCSRTWFDHVQERHQELRKTIGGIRIHSALELKDYQRAASESSCRVTIDQIVGLLPGYLGFYGLNRRDFLVPTLPSGMRIGKHLIFYAERIAKLNREQIQTLNNLIARLGEHWANARTTKQTIHTTLTTSAKGFVLLGHYGPDNGSCFGQTSANVSHKYNLAERENTFVLLIKNNKGRVDEPQNSQNTIARMWGFYKSNINGGTVNFCNFYARNSQYDNLLNGNALEICRQQAAGILKVETKSIKHTENAISIAGTNHIPHQYKPIWHNSTAKQNWTFYTGDHIETQFLEFK